MNKNTPLLIGSLVILATSSASAVTTTVIGGAGIVGTNYQLTTNTRFLDVTGDGVNDFEVTWDQDITISSGVNDSSNLFVGDVGDTLNVSVDFDSFEVTSLNPDLINATVVFDSWLSIRTFGLDAAGAQLDVGGTILTNPLDRVNVDHDSPVDSSIDSYTIEVVTGRQRFSGGGVGFAVTFDTVPEPSSTALLGLGGLALIVRRRR